MMLAVSAVVGALLIAVVLLDAFETVVLPRRVSRRWRLARQVLNLSWQVWSAPVRQRRSSERRESYLSFYGPLYLMLLVGLWAGALVLGFALLHWGVGSQMLDLQGRGSFENTVYGSGSTFFTLGIGDVTPHTTVGRALVVLESGMGLAFLAVMIAYVPVLYQSFSQREVNVSLLDARAGSPPSAVELLRRHAGEDGGAALGALMAEWERWAADLLESHLSYPVLAYYRSQHERESWLAALTTILDTSALLIVGVDGAPTRPAKLAFAIARHAAADLSQILGTEPQRHRGHDRLPPEELARVRELLAAAGLPLRDGDAADEKLRKLRRMYEPFVSALSAYLLMPLPRWLPIADGEDDWQITAWGQLDHDTNRGIVPAKLGK